MASQIEIARQVVESILAQKLKPGERLGEQALADMFGVSRTLVREALMQLQARGFVEVCSRKGWYVVEPSIEQARDAFAARRAVEAGMLRVASIVRDAGKHLQAVIRRLRQHVKEEQAAIDGADAAARQSCADHARIVTALAAGDAERAAQMMVLHIGGVEDGLGTAAARDPLERLRASLAPLVRPTPA